MSNRIDKPPTRRTPTLRTSESEAARQSGPASGRVAFDDRGNAKWEMRTAGNTYVPDGTTTLVRKLVPPLSLEPTVRVPKLATAAPSEGKPAPGTEAKPARAERTPSRAEMGTVRTFPVPRNPSAGRPKGTVMPKSPPQPAGLFGRLFGKKS